MMRAKFLISFMTFVFLFASAALAQFAVDVDVVPKNVSVPPCGIAVHDVTIDNLEDSDVFTILVDGIPADWYTLTETVVALNANETKTIYLFTTIDCFSPEKTYEGNLTVAGKSTDSAAFDVTVVPDHIIELDVASDVSFCLCEEGALEVTVSNRGLFEENVDLSIKGTATEFVSLTTTSLILKPNETQTVNLSVANVCQADPGVHSLEVTAKSRDSYARDSASSVVKRIKCYDFGITFEKEIVTCAVEEKPFSITVENVGTKSDEYEINIPSFNFTETKELAPGEKTVFNSTFLTTQHGSYEVPFTVTSNVLSKDDSITFVAEKCYDVDLQMESNEIAIMMGTGKLLRGKLINTGTKNDSYVITTDVTWAAIRPRTLTLEGNESGDVFAYYSPEYKTSGTFETVLLAISSKSQDEESVTVRVGEEEVPTTTTTQKQETTTTVVLPNITVPEVTTTLPTSRFVGTLVERITGNKILLSLIVGLLIALAVLVFLYYFVMRGG